MHADATERPTSRELMAELERQLHPALYHLVWHVAEAMNRETNELHAREQVELVTRLLQWCGYTVDPADVPDLVQAVYFGDFEMFTQLRGDRRN